MLLINELRYITRQPLLWLCFLAAPLFAYTLSAGLAVEVSDAINQLKLHLVALQMMQLALLTGALAPTIFLRDQIHNMHELVAATPITFRKRAWLRLSALVMCVFAIAFISMLVVVTQLLSNGFDWHIINLLFVNSLFMLFPNACLLSVIAFWFCQKFSSALVNYVVFAALWIGYLLLASVTGNPILAGSSIISETSYQLFIWLDPFAYTAIIASFSEPQGWIIAVNRVLILLLTSLIYFSAVASNQSNSFNKPVKNAVSKLQPVTVANASYRPAAAKSHGLAIFITFYKVALFNVLKHPITWIVLLAWPVMVFNSVASSAAYAEPLSVIHATSIDAISHYAFDMQILFGCLLMVLWSWQISCYARRFNMAELIAATPIKTATILYSQLLVLATLVITFSIMSFVGASLAQWFIDSQYDAYDHVYVLCLSSLPLMLIGWVTVCVFNIFRSTLVAGAIVFVMLLLKFTPVMTYLGLTHTFWSLAWTPLQPPSEFWGYRASISSYWPYMQMWLLAGISFILLTCVFSHRGAGFDRRAVVRKDAWLIMPVLLYVGLFVQLHLRLVDEKPLTNSHKREAFKANYEKNFVDWQHKLQPQVSHIDANIDFYPHQQSVKFDLTYTLKNRHPTAIKQILVGRAGFYKWADVKIAGASQIAFYPELNQAVYEFDIALKPHETRQLTTQFEIHQATLWPAGGHQIITPEFSYIRAVPALPTIGYQVNYELTDTQLRAQYGLQQKARPLASTLFNKQQKRPKHYERITMSSKISTAAGHQVVTQGKQITHQREQGREIFEFKTLSEINNLPAWLSVPFTAETKKHDGVTLQVFAKKQQLIERSDAIAVNFQAMMDTLDWFKNNIVAYKPKQLSIIAAPPFGGTGYALPQIILVEDTVGFRARPSDDAGFDQRYRRAVHETAHQWFGHDIGNSVSADSAFLIESMAKYIELVVIERHDGKAAMNALVDYETKRYEQASRMDITEKMALIDSTKSYEQYSKATIVFAKLRKKIGDEAIIKALNLVWENHSHPNMPATSMDFIFALKEQVNPQLSSLIDKLFLEI
ncbi:M1 family aminopeptidase [Pseudoalteromonas sp. APC 3224]|uniref:M1 family aminopeptidase n=1 Tax=Pseudoalteromonas sp. APC 3224 TaxID=3035203 RepID=UPI0025B2965F|nr:M1 family aminopeptidase [Pseudoalteromonas sp. APC 3224]MDN3485576.1 M1 family aminopeptidase [Pseudoalteromonas sp. APC 3224]